MNRLASELNMDPVALRLLNCYQEGDIGTWGEPIPSVVTLPEVIEACADRADWAEPSRPDTSAIFGVPVPVRRPFPSTPRAGVRLWIQECRVLLRGPGAMLGGS